MILPPSNRLGSSLSTLSACALLIGCALHLGDAKALAAPPDLLNIPVVDIEGRSGALAAFQGKVMLIVNVASECGYTRQYEGLEALYQKYKDQGFIVLGFPSNDFGEQEPAKEAEILQFCRSRYNVTFPLFSKVKLRVRTHPLFLALTSPESPIPGPITWNFNKFLLGKDGVLKARFQSDTEPDSITLQQAIEKELDGDKKKRP